MPNAWSAKDERQYEHIKENALDRGRSTARAKEIAARTVNKRRRKEGRTPNKTSQGTGNPNLPLDRRTVEELRQLASELAVRGRSKMNKRQLVQAIRRQR
jgi:hypothetical protein